MKVEIKGIKKFQEGGALPPQEAPEAAAPAPAAAPEQGGQDPLMMIAEMAVQALQAQDCNAAMQVCEAFIQLIQQAQGMGAPEEAPQGEPVYRKGGVLVRRIKQ